MLEQRHDVFSRRIQEIAHLGNGEFTGIRKLLLEPLPDIAQHISMEHEIAVAIVCLEPHKRTRLTQQPVNIAPRAITPQYGIEWWGCEPRSQAGSPADQIP